MREKLVVRPLTGGDAELPALYELFAQVPRFALAVNGGPFGPDEAQDLLHQLPPGKTMADKFPLGAYLGDMLVGCADLIRGYPSPSVATLGLLVVTEPYQGAGLGSELLGRVEDVVREWGGCDRIRLGVVRNNGAALPFWAAMGFVPTGEVKPYSRGTVTSEVVVMEKDLGERAGVE